jgi:hypothetical protein
MDPHANVRDNTAYRGEMQIAARATCAVLITAPPDDALEVARAIARERGWGDRILVCDFGVPGAGRIWELLEAQPDPRILLLREVHGLTPRQQALLMELMEEALSRRAPRIMASSSVSLFDCVKRGSFDARLFYRLNTVHVVLSDTRTPSAWSTLM